VPLGFDVLDDAIEDQKTDPRKGRSWPLRLAMTIDHYLAPVIKIFAVIAVAFAGLEYIERVNATRVERSLAEVEQWDSGGYRSAYQQVNALIWPLFSAQADYISGLPQAQQDLFYANIGEGITGQDNVFDGPADLLVDDLFYFFDRAALCAAQRICDEDVLKAFIGSDVADFWRYFSSYAKRRRDAGYGQYGSWTERLATSTIGSHP
jgi:hypothetical protein